ncbi:MAG: hypothetical protein JWO36_5589 [Myxococcales bacterium]|nr:hypothetical protein [Myxococcales bacterium]
MRLVALAVALGGCLTPPSLAVSGEPVPVVCETTGSAVLAGELGVAPTFDGATLVWVPPGGGALHSQRFSREARPVSAAVVVWPGAFQHAVVATVDDQVVAGAVAGDVTVMVSAPLGIAPFRELAILGGLAGPSPMVVAGGQRVSTTVSYGGLLVNGFDDKLGVHTSELAVLTTPSLEVAATAVGPHAIAAWSTDDACYTERIFGVGSGATAVEAGPCHAPRIASNGSDVALVFERPDGIYLARGTADALHPASAIRIAAGSAPRIVASGGGFWVSYLDETGTIAAGSIGADLELRTVALAGAPISHELAVVGDLPRVFAADQRGITISTLCLE